jgi:hypothetical protein
VCEEEYDRVVRWLNRYFPVILDDEAAALKRMHGRCIAAAGGIVIKSRGPRAPWKVPFFLLRFISATLSRARTAFSRRLRFSISGGHL